jgi:nicotinate-nucleotide adenylyltransferase
LNQKIGIIGGTFNPIHTAHLAIAEQFCDQLGIGKCYFVPTYISPFKIEENGKNDVSPHHRKEMVRLALGHNPHFVLDSFEIDRKEISYSYLTVNYFKQKYPDSELYFLIGQDQANHFHKWRNWIEIVSKSQLTIAKRVDESRFATKNREDLTTRLTMGENIPMWINNANMEISSSNIRERFRKNKSTNYLLPDSVYDYIKSNNLYSVKI